MLGRVLRASRALGATVVNRLYTYHAGGGRPGSLRVGAKSVRKTFEWEKDPNALVPYWRFPVPLWWVPVPAVAFGVARYGIDTEYPDAPVLVRKAQTKIYNALDQWTWPVMMVGCVLGVFPRMSPSVCLLFPSLRQALLSQFIQPGWLAALGNGVFLWVASDYVQRELGPARFVAFYFSSMVCSTAFAALANSWCTRAIVTCRPGASGPMCALAAMQCFVPRNSRHGRVLGYPQLFLFIYMCLMLGARPLFFHCVGGCLFASVFFLLDKPPRALLTV
eukprot:gnl/Spiro4/7839_TR4135_c0_g2_i1.p2 gnl/Spiro4/7839_TR4135_c0_g2~~gnl/Spiro4/7839_TR4135_c0_g2_i1.p2  ORF type:complete len:277 (+),score=39.21 gnl/Spiro4/7839_TR4135_c0_g2_i1:112-942(+)